MQDRALRGWLTVKKAAEYCSMSERTVRTWLKQGLKISVKNAPTYFGVINYEITSHVDTGKILANVNLSNRTLPKAVLLRLRHPQAKTIQRVKVNGQSWQDFDSKAEAIRLSGSIDRYRVVAEY